MRGVGTQRPNKSKVSFSDADEVREYSPDDTAADPVPPDHAQQTLTGKRGRPPQPVEHLSPLQLAEKRMKMAEEDDVRKEPKLQCAHTFYGKVSRCGTGARLY